MSALQISRAAREQVKALLSAQFNALLSAACDEFRIADQAFEIEYEAPDGNLFEGSYRVQDLRQYVGQYGPCQCVYAKSARDEHEQIPCAWNGPVEIHVDTHLRWSSASDSTAPPDTETLCDAVEAAIVGVLQDYALQLRSGTVAFERTEPEKDTGYWYCSVLCSAELEVTV